MFIASSSTMTSLENQQFSETHIEGKDLWWKSLKWVSNELELLRSHVALDDIKKISPENIAKWFDAFKENDKYFWLEYRKDWKTKEYEKKSVQYIFLLQAGLAYLGKDCWKIDGVWGKKTKDVVKTFQQEQWLSVTTGIPNDETIKRLVTILAGKNEIIKEAEIAKKDLIEAIIKDNPEYVFSTKTKISSGFTKEEISKWIVSQKDDKNISRDFEVYYIMKKDKPIDPGFYLIISEKGPMTVGIGKMEYKNRYIYNNVKYWSIEKRIGIDASSRERQRSINDFSAKLKTDFRLLGV